jgi:glucose/arabinose dehydrogenase
MGRLSPAVLVASLSLTAWTPGAEAQITTRLIASGLSAPVDFVQDPSDRSVQYIVEQGGRIRVLKAGALRPGDFLNLAGSISSGGERGLLGLAFPPDYATSGRFFVNFTNPAGHTVIARFRRSATNPLLADPASRVDLLWGSQRFIAQPFSNHNGGHLAFGPDGYLYIGLGDGGSGNDPQHNAQNPATRLGKFLRIDVNVPDSDHVGFRIPPDNPFIGSPLPGVLPEIWSFGLRNPWKFSFDDPALGGTGALIVADVGQSAREEINYEPAGRGGRNYGWRNREGRLSNIGSPPPAYLPLTDPIFDYDRSAGSSVTGGYVYRGLQLGAAMRGRYFFADFISGRLWSLGLSIGTNGEAQHTGVIDHTAQLGGFAVLGNISSLGVDAAGELYILSYSLGTVRAIASTLAPPRNLRIVR